MVEIAVISDTHVPTRASSIPAWVRERVRSADRTIHAGDFVSPRAYEAIGDLAPGELIAVSGNMDRIPDLPSTDSVSLGGVTFVVTHGTGPERGYEGRVADVVREQDGDVGVAGHTHEPLDTTHEDVRILNPGTATGAAPASSTSMMTVTAADGSIDVELHER